MFALSFYTLLKTRPKVLAVMTNKIFQSINRSSFRHKRIMFTGLRYDGN